MEYFQMFLPLILAVLCIVFFKPITGFVIIKENEIGLINKKFRLFGKKTLDGGIVAFNGEPGYQAQTLSAGWYLGKWFWKYSIVKIPFVEIPTGYIGLINAKDGLPLPQGKILSMKDVDCDNFQNSVAFLKNGGEKGKQAKFLNTGVYKINTLLFDVITKPIVRVNQNFMGIVTTFEGQPLSAGEIAGESDIKKHGSFSDVKSFIENGGCKGLQTQVIQSGTYAINPWFASVEEAPLTVVPIGHVGVVISYVGKKGVDVSGLEFKHGNIVSEGEKGVWGTPLDPNKYAMNPFTCKVENVQTTNIVLNWANAKSEAHKLDEKLCTITVRSKDGFNFNLDVSQIIHIPSNQASRVIARFGSVQNLVSQVLEPTIGNYFRNSAQSSDAISFIQKRMERQKEAKEHIQNALSEYNVTAVDTLIGDINPPEALMKTLTDRRIAEELQVTYETQRMSETKRQELVKQTAQANIQDQIVEAEQNVLMSAKRADAKIKEAEGAAKATTLSADAIAYKTKVEATATADAELSVGTAKATVIQKNGEAKATAYKLQVEAVGKEGLVSMNNIEAISKSGMKLVPEVNVSSNGQSANIVEALLAMNFIKPNTAVLETIAKEKDKK